MYFHLALPRAGHKLAYKVTIRRTTIERIADGEYWTKIAHELSWAIGVNIALDDSEGIKKILNPYLKGKFKLGKYKLKPKVKETNLYIDKLKIMKYLSSSAVKVRELCKTTDHRNIAKAWANYQIAKYTHELATALNNVAQGAEGVTAAAYRYHLASWIDKSEAVMHDSGIKLKMITKNQNATDSKLLNLLKEH